jgi:hypothetical protein
LSDSFTVSGDNGAIGDMNFGVWVSAGDTVSSVDIQIGDQALSNNLMDLTVNLTQSACFSNGGSLVVCQESASFNGPDLNNGTYWVTLSKATIANGDPVFWDVNYGIGCQSQGCPSQAQSNYRGDEPSETFALLSENIATTPEPDSLSMILAGITTLGGAIARKRCS